MMLQSCYMLLSGGIVFFPFIISVQKVMLCQAKHICYSPSIVGFINTTTFITQQVFSLHHSLSQFVFYWHCQYRSSLSSGFKKKRDILFVVHGWLSTLHIYIHLLDFSRFQHFMFKLDETL